MREIPPLFHHVNQLLGITPAYAGNTRRYWRTCKWCRDHPRVCGKYTRCQNRVWTQIGSPPRMREILRKKRRKLTNIRITPAYAGNTELSDYASNANEDHPRVCGKYRLHLRCVRRMLGSPPRMREIQSFTGLASG